MTLYMIRHGQTVMNTRGALQGRSDHPLNEKGVEQAEQARRRFEEKGISFDVVYTSPLCRAVQTAEILARGADIITDERLIEMDYGPYEGMDLRSPPPELMAFFMDIRNTPAPDGMEPLPEVVARLGSLLEDIRNARGSILLSTHAIAMKGALEYLTPDSRGGYWSKNIENCAVYVSGTEAGKYMIPYEMP
ncbi:MAG: histidine phosphatase family protein [Oscillospiraceae bacterium]|nr:histidine phosphatase family protein [Oscillospiraceae bacterium]